MSGLPVPFMLRFTEIIIVLRIESPLNLFKGVNDSLVYAKEIVRLLRGIECRINLIRFHAIPNVDLEGTGMEHIIAFRDYLTQHGVFSTIRASRGEDIFAACGMLSTAKQQEEKNKNQ